jgi:hypothetical protein
MQLVLLCFIMSLTLVSSLVGANHQAHAGEADFRVPKGQRQLFLDDHGIAKLENIKRTMHQPDKKGAVIRPNWQLGVSSVQVRTAPVWDPQEKIFKFWDCAATPPDLYAAGKPCSGYYESRDGLDWSQPALRQIEYERCCRRMSVFLSSVFIIWFTDGGETPCCPP